MKSPVKFTFKSIIFFILFFVTCPELLSDTHYVSPAGGNIPPFTSWATAAKNIQDAVDAASAGDLVLVSNGVYNSSERPAPGYALSNRVVITKNITVRSVNGPENTIILGKEAPGGSLGPGAVRCVYMEAGTISGFTISNGNTLTSGSDIYEKSGGGIWLTNGCVVTNCTISGNNADICGGGAYCSGGSISDCTISRNSAQSSGGGVYCNEGSIVTGCRISGKNSAISGGGVYCHKGGAVSDCTISGNGAGHGGGGGVHCREGGTVSGCTISGNSAGGFSGGGGVLCYKGGSVSDCTISDNSTAGFGSSGGGLLCDNGGSVSDCVISGNSADFGGGVTCHFGGALTNCQIYGMNSATFGGGVFFRSGGEAYNCTIAGNIADYGGGVSCTNGGKIINTILYSNQAIQDGDNWFANGSGVTFSYCCTTPTNNLPGGNGCIPDNPKFIAPGSDYHLTGASPCVDAGITLAWMTGATDLDGNPRLFNGKVDMGPYEYLSGKIPVTSPNWKLKNKKKGALKGKPIAPLLIPYLTNGYGIGIWDLGTDSNVDGPRQLTAKNKKGTVWVFKDKTDKTAKIIYSEKYKKKKDIYKTKLKYVLQGQIPESNMVYVAPLE